MVLFKKVFRHPLPKLPEFEKAGYRILIEIEFSRLAYKEKLESVINQNYGLNAVYKISTVISQ